MLVVGCACVAKMVAGLDARTFVVAGERFKVYSLHAMHSSLVVALGCGIDRACVRSVLGSCGTCPNLACTAARDTI